MLLINFALTIFFSIFFIIETKFNNVVEYPKDLNQGVYKFELTFEEGLSMSINSKEIGEFDPVNFNLTDGRFYVRNKNLFEKCGIQELVTDISEIDSIVVTDGRHRNFQVHLLLFLKIL